MILGLPWWVFMLILLIFLSGYMAFRAMRAERQLEDYRIQQQGQVYIERMERERQEKQRQRQLMSSSDGEIN